MSPGLWLWLAALLHPRPAHAAVNEYVLASSPPGRVDGASVHFTDVLPTGAVVKWAVPPLGDWGLPIVGYRLRMSTERDFPKTLSPTHALRKEPYAKSSDATFAYETFRQ